MRWLLGLTILIWPTILLAAFDVGAAAPKTVPFKTFEDVVSRLFDFGITLGGIIFLILFLVGGIMYLVSAGNEDQTGKAKRLMVDAIIGLVLVLGAWAIANFVFKQLTVGTPIGSGGIGSSGSPTSTPTTPGRLPISTSTTPGPIATSREPGSTDSSTLSPSPSSISIQLSVFSVQKNDLIKDNSVKVTIDQIAADGKSQAVVAGGQPDSIGALLLTFSPKPGNTYKIIVKDNADLVLTTKELKTTTNEQTFRLEIP